MRIRTPTLFAAVHVGRTEATATPTLAESPCCIYTLAMAHLDQVQVGENVLEAGRRRDVYGAHHQQQVQPWQHVAGVLNKFKYTATAPVLGQDVRV